MKPDLGRRDFLKSTLALAGSYFVTASLPGTALRAHAAETSTGTYRFPQGLASADPRPDAIVLWTRVEASDKSDASISVTLEMSTSDTFDTLVLTRDFEATNETDHTIRVVVDGLEADTRYFYRFRAGTDTSPHTGRTRTAPHPSADRNVNFAFVSCQHYEEGFYGAWRHMVNDDLKTPEDKQIDFVLNLGDFIYEYRKTDPNDDTLLVDRHGAKRSVPPFPGDTGTNQPYRYARTLDDYRHLYKTYLSDPDLQAARARWPFISTWDDHEFSNDSWQSRATYTTAGLPGQSRKVAANQAWFEYIPALLSRSQTEDAQTNPARDFVFVDVTTNDSTEDYAHEPNNLAAIASMTIYRNLTYGRHLELVITDTRSNRSDHAVPEELAAQLGRGRTLLPLKLVSICDAGRTYNDHQPPATIELGDLDFPNPRRNDPAGTVLGAAQKDWWKRTMTKSEATWKCWANSIPMLPLRIDLDDLAPGQFNMVLSTDSWDGYPAERSDLMTYLKDNAISNVFSVSGDHHMHFAGLVMDDYEADEPIPVATEFSTGAISSTSVLRSLLRRQDLDEGFARISYMKSSEGKEADPIALLNLTILQGAKASMVAQQTKDMKRAMTTRNPKQNPHLAYLDSNANGYSLASVTRESLDVRMVAVQTPTTDYEPNDSRTLYTAAFTVPRAENGEQPTLEGPHFEGDKPFPFNIG
ncbi:MAG: alkaline phosphatase D family protein [Candidatus Hydrogenedentes bacterium]|nr:alkaline phosphatase D family protein [Candidatus Hydrogenedentota bacterium]